MNMPAFPFYTRSPALAGLRRLVLERTGGKFGFDNFKELFAAVDDYCAGHFPDEPRGDWFTPKVFGGAKISHAPPHVLFSVLGIYTHLACGDPDPVPFLAGPLERDRATAVSLAPTDRFLVLDREGHAHPMTDFLLVLPSLTPRNWIQDTYGLPEPQPGTLVVGWHIAAQPHATAVSCGQLLLDPGSGKALNPLANFTAEESRSFFREPVNPTRLGRHRERLVEMFNTPVGVMERNQDCARRILDAYASL